MQLPGPVRAVVGLVATAADEARHLPERAVELPMLAVSSALQLSLRAQQRYARLAARGDELINRRPTGDEPPAWARFDEPVSDDDLRSASRLLDDVLRADEPGADEPGADQTDADEPGRATPVPARRPAAKRPAAAKKAPAKRAAAKKTAGKTINRPRNGAPSRFDTVADD